MRGPLVGFAGEAPPGYVAFVARHLEPLRRDAARAMGDEDGAQRLYPDVLTDVAARWTWLELVGTRLGRPDAAERYLKVAFDRRFQRCQAAGADEPTNPSDVVVLRPGVPLPAQLEPVIRPVGPHRPERSSAAVRQAGFLRPARTPVGPLAEAAIAWWHAYESHRRRVLVGLLVLFAVVSLLLLRLAPGDPTTLP